MELRDENGQLKPWVWAVGAAMAGGGVLLLLNRGSSGATPATVQDTSSGAGGGLGDLSAALSALAGSLGTGGSGGTPTPTPTPTSGSGGVVITGPIPALGPTGTGPTSGTTIGFGGTPSPTPSPTPVPTTITGYLLKIAQATTLYHPNGTVAGTITKGTYTTTKTLVNGKWRYYITGSPTGTTTLKGDYFLAEPWFSVTPIRTATSSGTSSIAVNSPTGTGTTTTIPPAITAVH